MGAGAAGVRTGGAGDGAHVAAVGSRGDWGGIGEGLGSGGVWGAAVGAERSALPVGWGNGVGGSGAARMGLSSAAVGCDGGIGSLLLRRGGDAVPSALSAPRDGPSNSFYFRCPPIVGPFIKAELSSSSSAPSFGVGRSSPRRITEPFRASPTTLHHHHHHHPPPGRALPAAARWRRAAPRRCRR